MAYPCVRAEPTHYAFRRPRVKPASATGTHPRARARFAPESVPTEKGQPAILASHPCYNTPNRLRLTNDHTSMISIGQPHTILSLNVFFLSSTERLAQLGDGLAFDLPDAFLGHTDMPPI